MNEFIVTCKSGCPTWLPEWRKKETRVRHLKRRFKHSAIIFSQPGKPSAFTGTGLDLLITSRGGGMTHNESPRCPCENRISGACPCDLSPSWHPIIACMNRRKFIRIEGRQCRRLVKWLVITSWGWCGVTWKSFGLPTRTQKSGEGPLLLWVLVGVGTPRNSSRNSVWECLYGDTTSWSQSCKPGTSSKLSSKTEYPSWYHRICQGFGTELYFYPNR